MMFREVILFVLKIVVNIHTYIHTLLEQNAGFMKVNVDGT